MYRIFLLLFSLLFSSVYAQKPEGLMCEMLSQSDSVTILSKKPSFSWIVKSAQANDRQTSYQIIVSDKKMDIDKNVGEIWDSKKVKSNQNIHIAYQGKPLQNNTTYYWKVKTWNKEGTSSEYSLPFEFHTAELSDHYFTEKHSLNIREVKPIKILQRADQTYFVDFGKDAFASLKIRLNSALDNDTILFHLGERLSKIDSLDRSPTGTIRYRKVKLPVKKGTHTYKLTIPSDKRNTGEHAILMPASIGEVMPFRYCEIEKYSEKIESKDITQLAVNYHFDDSSSYFSSSDQRLNAIWDLCKYSIKATSFLGIYVDGDRERIPYEGDTYINQLSHYYTDREFAIARKTHEYLITKPTWPTEWILHSVIIAWFDYLYTGNKESLNKYYSDLSAKTLLSLAREDGLISIETGLLNEDILKSVYATRLFEKTLKDLIDWPPSERDGYELMPINTVINAFHYYDLVLMSKISASLGKSKEQKLFIDKSIRVKNSFNEKFFNKSSGLYVDGENSVHSSQHANFFALAFGLVPKERKETVVNFVKSKEMACSVYGAQYLLEALYNEEEAAHALSLITADGLRGWLNMIDVGSTITLEAWDQKFKANLDWNHAWGAAPANIIPRYIMGVQPLEPGYSKILIKPQPENLGYARAKIPSIQGPIFLNFINTKDRFAMDLNIPANTSAKVYLPKRGKNVVRMDGNIVKVNPEGSFLYMENVGSGLKIFTVE